MEVLSAKLLVSGAMLAMLSTLLLVTGVDGDCLKVDSCSCRNPATGELISLGSLAKGDNTPAIGTTSEKYDYFYNPCLPFAKGTGSQCDGVALCQEDTQEMKYYGLGNQSTAAFVNDDMGGIMLEYTGHKTDSGKVRRSNILLQCDRNATTPVLHFMGEIGEGVYKFTLVSECACPGVCHQFQETCLPEGEKKCSCRLFNGQSVNIGSLDQPNAPLIATSGNSKVTLNPCTGVNVGPGVTSCRDVTVCLEQSGAYTDYGVASTAEYAVINDVIVLSYHSADRARRTNIELICDAGQRHYPKLSIREQPSATELNLQLHSVCACPDACFSPAVDCDKVDDCSCRLADGSGSVSLHALDNPVAPVLSVFTDHWNITYDYYYNPCTSFTSPAPNDNCTDVAVCQMIPQNKQDFNIGVQDDVTFRVSNTESDVVTFNYHHGNDGRQSFMRLQCNATREIPLLRFDGESPLKSYHFILESKDSCVQRHGNAISHARIYHDNKIQHARILRDHMRSRDRPRTRL